MRAVGLALVLCLPGGIARAEEKEIKEVLDRALAALGGEKNLAGVGAITLKLKGTLEVNTEKFDVSGDWSFSGLDRYRWDAEAVRQGKTIRAVVAGTAAKAFLIGDNGEANDLPAEIGNALHQSVRCLRLGQSPWLLRDKKLTLAPLGELKINDRPAAGIKVSQKGLADVDLFFDRKTGLPVKSEVRLKEAKDGMEVVHTYLFNEHRDAGKVKHFTKLKFLRDEMTHFDLELSEIKPQEKLDDTVFAKPAKQ